jgi:serine/threonine-protein kinase
MELAAGYDTGRWLRRKGQLKPDDVLTIAESVAVALDYAVKKLGIIHCDIKPANIMVDGDGTVRITDMGIARFIKGAQTTEFISGTPCYMSPEQATGEAELDSRADIYSLGATIYHLLTGRALFAGKKDDEILECQCTDQMPDVREFNPAVSRPCAVLLAKFLAKDRDNRPAGWSEAIADIRAVLAFDDAKRKRGGVKGLERFEAPSTMALADPVRDEASGLSALLRKFFWPVVGVAAVVAFLAAFALVFFL